MLIVIRLLGFLAIATMGAACLAYVLTRNRRWLRFAFQVLRLSVVAGVVLVLLYMLERLL
jgi:branched-subunit amino acid transport protein